ncbi:N-acetyl-gamma-glutamyl-phosphate reductase [Mangrovicella endophytica]|uniref:N-acetyl-gamma-glutamyl-phosphate reductase n=1 Tax=Mangrovicella endophytica TaxID=2066697 RepID=UPI000C9E5F4D|nr:N-acetyl-gamma-glutamyl-phosphate reductase [Mangrovicella endophytica]
MADRIRIGVLGASGYTGADLVRLALRHPNIEIAVLTANSHAGKPMKAVFRHFSHVELPDLVKVEDANWGSVDAVFCGLPHGTTQAITKEIFESYPAIKIIDMSADFRLRDPAAYKEWYGLDHAATEIQPEAVYGLTERYRHQIAASRLIACPGCYPTAVLLSLLPLTTHALIDPNDIVIDAKSGVSGAGRGLKENTLFCEAGEGLSPYSVGSHRHMAEIEQEIGLSVGQSGLRVNFTPHLIPMSRGELCTSYVRLAPGHTAQDLRHALVETYKDEPFVTIADQGVLPQTQMVRGSNYVVVNVVPDRIPGRAIVISTLDNLVKGSAGQAIQNFNVAYDIEETTGIEQLPLFP